jgi:hypothetical protein
MCRTKIVLRGRAVAKLVAGVVIATGIATWSAPAEARRHVFGHNLHSFRHTLHPLGVGFHPFREGLHPFREGLNGAHLLSLQSSYSCSVLGHRPCIPYGTYCSIFSHRPCIPDIDYPIGETLQLTIISRSDNDTSDTSAERDTAPRDLNTIRDVFSALRTCWLPPEKDVARSGTQITLRLSFNSHGGMISEPRTTYVTPDTPPDVRQVYWDAATAALKRCAPLQFTDGLGGALAGRPFAIRFVDDRSF